MINTVLLVGRLGKEPEIKAVKEHKVLRLSIATDAGYKDKATGAWVDAVEWHNITIWNKQAEYVVKYGFKGAILMVKGHLKTRKYQDQSGNDRYDYHVEPEQVKLLNPKKLEGGGQGPSHSAPPPGEDDLPF